MRLARFARLVLAVGIALDRTSLRCGMSDDGAAPERPGYLLEAPKGRPLACALGVLEPDDANSDRRPRAACPPQRPTLHSGAHATFEVRLERSRWMTGTDCGPRLPRWRRNG